MLSPSLTCINDHLKAALNQGFSMGPVSSQLTYALYWGTTSRTPLMALFH